MEEVTSPLHRFIDFTPWNELAKGLWFIFQNLNPHHNPELSSRNIFQPRAVTNRDQAQGTIGVDLLPTRRWFPGPGQSKKKKDEKTMQTNQTPEYKLNRVYCKCSTCDVHVVLDFESWPAIASKSPGKVEGAEVLVCDTCQALWDGLNSRGREFDLVAFSDAVEMCFKSSRTEEVVDSIDDIFCEYFDAALQVVTYKRVRAELSAINE